MKYALALILSLPITTAHAGFFDFIEDTFSKTGIFHKKGNGHDRGSFDGPIFPEPPLIEIPPGGFDEDPLDDKKDPDPAAVPVPAAIWLFLSGLAGLAFISRRK